MKIIFKISIYFFLLSVCSNKSFSQAGTLDQTFGEGGIVINDSFSPAHASIIQNDGKIIVVGTSLTSNVLLWRFNADGSIDESFGFNGKIAYSFEGKFRSSFELALEQSGNLIVTGEYYTTNNVIDIGIIRCKPDGKLDSSFGVNGLDSLHFNNYNFPSGLIIQMDGKIVLNGITTNTVGISRTAFIARLMPKGGLDLSFGTEGVVLNNYSSNTLISSLVIRPNGKLLMGGTFSYVTIHGPYLVQSFNPDGSVDASFGENGKATYNFNNGVDGPGFNNELEAMVLQDDGKIVCTGSSGRNDDISMAVCRFNADGSIDESFGDKGGVITVFTEQPLGYAENRDVIMEIDGKIITVGDEDGFGDDPGKLLLTRYNENGQPDPSFGENGIASVQVDDVNGQSGRSVHIVADNKILVTGTTGQFGQIYLARFNNDKVLAANFKDVKATQENNAITITWQTLNESSTKSYTVERSGNANDYVNINTVPAKGVASNYSYTDKNPLDGISYYRIRENAINGTNTFSPVVKVVFNDNGVISLYPNPANNTVMIKGLNKNVTAIIKITDMQGREISSQNFTQSSSATLNIRSLAQGTYFVQVAQEGKVVRLKMVKE
ncbi:MAG: T9SS type A sorting domain-containing protein [Chitinophagaceae bacterium]